MPPFRVDTIDAVGCGDAFVAGLLSVIVEQNDWRKSLSLEKMTQALQYANAVGALTSLKRGAIPAMPTKKEVEKFLEGK